MQEDNHNQHILKSYYVYILANNLKTTYIGITNNLERRISEHKIKAHDGFTSQHNINKLVYYEEFYNVYEAISREKQLKNLHRARKFVLVEKNNPTWEDLSKDFDI